MKQYGKALSQLVFEEDAEVKLVGGSLENEIYSLKVRDSQVTVLIQVIDDEVVNAIYLDKLDDLDKMKPDENFLKAVLEIIDYLIDEFLDSEEVMSFLNEDEDED